MAATLSAGLATFLHVLCKRSRSVEAAHDQERRRKTLAKQTGLVARGPIVQQLKPRHLVNYAFNHQNIKAQLRHVSFLEHAAKNHHAIQPGTSSNTLDLRHVMAALGPCADPARFDSAICKLGPDSTATVKYPPALISTCRAPSLHSPTATARQNSSMS